MEPLRAESKNTKKAKNWADLSPMFWALISLILAFPSVPGLAMQNAQSELSLTQKPALAIDIDWQDPDWWQASWAPRDGSEDADRKALYNLLRIVKNTSFGDKLIRTAFKRYPKFYQKISIGHRSFTESTYSRTYSLKDGSEDLEIENHLTINRKLSRIDAVYDLTHELVHFLFRKPHNPYRMEFSMPEFVRHGIEGKGGELQAFEAECRIAWEIERKARVEPHKLCAKYRNELEARREKEKNRKFDRGQATKDFYAVGNYFVTLQGLQIELPALSNKHPTFISSLENSPYPYALIQEFVNVRKMACENNVRKARLIQQQAARARDGRDPAADVSSLSKEYTRLSKYFRRHCQTEISK